MLLLLLSDFKAFALSTTSITGWFESELMAVQHRDVVLHHLRCLGLRLNVKKSSLTAENYFPGGSLGLSYDAGTVVSCSYKYHLDHSNKFQAGPNHHCQTLSESAGSPGSSVHSFWPTTHESLTVVAQNQGVLPRGNPFWMIMVTQCLCALVMWKKNFFPKDLCWELLVIASR